MSNEKLFNNILVHIFIQHSDNEIFFVHTIYDFWQCKIVRAQTQIMTTITYLREELPKHMIVPSMNYLFKQIGINVVTQCTECLKFPGRNPNLFNFLSSASNLNWLSALIKPDQAGEAYIKLEIILACVTSQIDGEDKPLLFNILMG